MLLLYRLFIHYGKKCQASLCRAPSSGFAVRGFFAVRRPHGKAVVAMQPYNGARQSKTARQRAYLAHGKERGARQRRTEAHDKDTCTAKQDGGARQRNLHGKDHTFAVRQTFAVCLARQRWHFYFSFLLLYLC